jgi:hypothetical protein
MGNMIVCCVDEKHNQFDNGVSKNDELMCDNDS